MKIKTKKKCLFWFFCVTLIRFNYVKTFKFHEEVAFKLTEEDEEDDNISITRWIENVEKNFDTFNKYAAKFTWDLMINPTQQLADDGLKLHLVRNDWKNQICSSKKWSSDLTYSQRRKFYLFCRGGRYNTEMAKMSLVLMGKLSGIYNLPGCLPSDQPGPLQSLAYPNQNTSDYPTPGECLRGEPDLERLMKRTDLNPDQLKWIWLGWHDFVGPLLKDEFFKFNRLENLAAKMNGYNNMGDAWKEELEIPNLESAVFKLYEEIKPLYVLLHAVVRHKLLLKYGPLEIDPLGPIPIHLLGNMWGQDWSKLIEIFLPPSRMIDLDKRLKQKKWKMKDLVVQAEDMYTSMGLHPMTENFWNHSIFEKSENFTLCHGSASFMYRKDDVRMFMCGQIDMENFYVIHHEIGHLQYFLAYQNQSSIFQSGANSAMHESIGDSIMPGVFSPAHLHRLNLITDEELVNSKTDFYLLLLQALTKIPEIPFSLIIDKYRWDIFSGDIDEHHCNEAYWMLNKELRGVVPPEKRGEEFFDAAGKFHLADNTPYIRYFLSSILQMEMFKGFCEISLYGKTRGDDDYQEINIFPLHKCDIYGSKKCGRHLIDMMQQGASIPWVDALDILIGKRKLSAKPLLEYYKPIYKWLKRYVKKHNVPVGW